MSSNDEPNSEDPFRSFTTSQSQRRLGQISHCYSSAGDETDKVTPGVCIAPTSQSAVRGPPGSHESFVGGYPHPYVQGRPSISIDTSPATLHRERDYASHSRNFATQQ